ncbi:MAG TPA: DUF2007 domain-containing protein [Gemmataceae bacterium]|jgi:hypothetical protein
MSTEPSDDIVRVATAENSVQAHIWEQALQDAGIRVQVVGDYLEAGFGNLQGTTPELWVHRDDVERAKAILNEHAAAEPDEESDSASGYDQDLA